MVATRSLRLPSWAQPTRCLTTWVLLAPDSPVLGTITEATAPTAQEERRKQGREQQPGPASAASLSSQQCPGGLPPSSGAHSPQHPRGHCRSPEQVMGMVTGITPGVNPGP